MQQTVSNKYPLSVVLSSVIYIGLTVYTADSWSSEIVA